MMESELDFMKATVLSKSMDDVTLYNDMPLEEMAADPDFAKKYLFGLAMMLKKGLHLNFIHDISRPFSEMMMALENYIPMYMTGQISPYYLPSPGGSVFNHLLKVSGAAALEGNAITGSQSEGRYVLYRSKEDVAHYRKRAERLLSKARPLMDIFTSDRQAEFPLVMDRLHTAKDIRFICSKLPLYFLGTDSFEELLEKLALTDGETERLRRYYNRARSNFLLHITENPVKLVLPALRDDSYESSPLCLSFAELFMDTSYEVPLETCRRYYEDLEQLSKEHTYFRFEKAASPVFQNINVSIAGDRMVIVSKEKSPTIHFVIYHSRMIRAFQDFMP